MSAAKPTPRAQVVALEELGAADVATAGGKAANLGELLRLGLPVPPGFVVTTEAYVAAAERAGLGKLLSEAGSSPAALREALLASPVPRALSDEVAAAYLRLGDDVPVAVRSSATAEDMPGAAFAGQQDTYLGVVGAEAVVDAVRRCWASLWTDRAVAYRLERDVDPAEVRIAVVVQAMVAAEAAGVMLTADPVSGARDRLVVDASPGLGEALVSGLVTPDHHVLDRRGRLLEWAPGRDGAVRASPAGGARGAEVGIGWVPTPDGTARVARRARGAEPDGALLSRETLAALAGHARTIAAHFGRPQDIEWALAAGRIWILQARPMTALPPAHVPLTRTQRLQAAILTEYLPVRPFPMDVTTQVALGPAKMMHDIASYFGVEGAFAGFLREEDGVVVELVPPRLRPTPRVLLTPFKLARKARRFKAFAWSRDPRQQAFLAEIAALEALDLGSLAWPELLEVPGRALATIDYCRDLRIDYLPGVALALVRTVVAARLLGRADLLADLLGGVRTRTDDADRALAALADQVRSDSELRALVLERDAAEVLAAVTADEDLAGFRAALAGFLREFGRRETASPLLVSQPTLVESPEVVIGMVRSLAQREGRPDEPSSRSAAALERLLDHPWLRARGRRQRMRRWVQAAREGVAFREDTHFYFTAALPTLRRAVLEVGRRLQGAGLLADASDVFHLRWEEVAAIGDPRRVPTEQAAALQTSVRLRSAKRAELAGVPLIDPARVFPSKDADQALVTGTPAGAGMATGVARIVRGAEEFDRLGAGEVLVCPYTNPAWTPLFQRAAAVVVDTGSTASHAAIVAREQGIPAIMGTGTGTSVIRDGETITVDGTRGRVVRAS